jgi:hypothetical protein
MLFPIVLQALHGLQLQVSYQHSLPSLLVRQTMSDDATDISTTVGCRAVNSRRMNLVAEA